MTDNKPLVLPEPRKIKVKSGQVKLPEFPLRIKGADAKVIDMVNRALNSLPPVQAQTTGLIFIPYSEQESKTPNVICRIGQGFTPRFAPGRNQFEYDHDDVRREAYRITIAAAKDPNSIQPQIIIDARTNIGLQHALFTLVQLLRQYGQLLPALVIEDAPVFPARGVMLDVSRDRVPQRKELHRLVDRLASWKINHVQLYIEHTFVYPGHEVIWQDASPLLPEDIRDLDRRCRDYGITLAANQNCFGHLHRWLEHPDYQHLAELTGEWDFNGFPKKGPFSLCPIDPESIKFVKQLLDFHLPNFTSNLANVGCDETFDVGQGRSIQAVQESGEFGVYRKFVDQILEIVRKHNFTPMIWADMWLKHANPHNLPPEDTISLVWGYEKDTPFEYWCEKLHAHERHVWVCPGTSSWRSITGRSDVRRKNLHNAAIQGIAAGANGYLVTEWGDLGHRQQFPITLFGLAEGANCAWNGSSPDKIETAVSLHVFGDRELQTANWLYRFGTVDIDLRNISGKPDKNGNPTCLRNATALFNDLENSWDKIDFAANTAGWQKVNDSLAELHEDSPKTIDSRLIEEIEHAWEVAKFAAERAILRREHSSPGEEVKSGLFKQINQIIQKHRHLWLQRSRPGGLKDSVEYYQNKLNELDNSN